MKLTTLSLEKELTTKVIFLKFNRIRLNSKLQTQEKFILFTVMKLKSFGA